MSPPQNAAARRFAPSRGKKHLGRPDVFLGTAGRMHIITGIATAVLALLLQGCVTPGPATRFYILTPTPGAPPAETAARATDGLTIVVKDLRLPIYLDRPQIVSRDAGNHLEFSELEQWGGPLREDMTRVLVTNLGKILDRDRIIAAPYPASSPPDYRIEVDILGFERQPDGRVALNAQWWITRGRDGALHGASKKTFEGAPLADVASYDKLVTSMSAVYGELAKAIALSIRPTEAVRP